MVAKAKTLAPKKVAAKKTSTTAQRKPAAKKVAAPVVAQEPRITTYKGFDKNWQCRGFQYEIGKEYQTDKALACNYGFHACENPRDVLKYYRASTNPKFAIVDQWGDLSRHDDDSKVASTHLSVNVEISLTDLIKASIKYTMDRCKPAIGATSKKANTSVQAHGNKESATASGDYGAATASGYYGAATASGDSGKAQGKEGCALFLVYRNDARKIVHAKAAIVGQDGIKADTFYHLDSAGNFVEVE